MSRTRAPPRLAARIPRGRTPDCPCILGLRGLCRGRYVQIHQGRRSTSPADLQKHESPRRSAGLGKRAKRACASANRVHPRPGDNQEHRGSLFLWVESGSARRLCAPRSTASRRRVPRPVSPGSGIQERLQTAGFDGAEGLGRPPGACGPFGSGVAATPASDHRVPGRGARRPEDGRWWTHGCPRGPGRVTAAGAIPAVTRDAKRDGIRAGGGRCREWLPGDELAAGGLGGFVDAGGAQTRPLDVVGEPCNRGRTARSQESRVAPLPARRLRGLA